MSTPVWSDVDDDTADLLDLIADSEHTGAPSVAEEWAIYLSALGAAADGTGWINPNVLRGLTRDRVAPQRIGAFARRACRENVIRPDGWVVSTDTRGRNSGRPVRAYRLVREAQAS